MKRWAIDALRFTLDLRLLCNVAMHSIQPRNAPRLRPLSDRVYVKQDPLPEQDRGLWLPDQAKKHKVVRYGTVLAVGPGKLDEETGGRLPMQCQVGDRVAFPDYWGDCIGLDTDPSLLIGPESGESGLLAIVGGGVPSP